MKGDPRGAGEQTRIIKRKVMSGLIFRRVKAGVRRRPVSPKELGTRWSGALKGMLLTWNATVAPERMSVFSCDVRPSETVCTRYSEGGPKSKVKQR